MPHRAGGHQRPAVRQQPCPGSHAAPELSRGQNASPSSLGSAQLPQFRSAPRAEHRPGVFYLTHQQPKRFYCARLSHENPFGGVLWHAKGYG